MIFVTVGTDGPFDRLIAAVDRWAGERGRTDVIAQIGRSRLRPQFVRSYEFLEPPQFQEYFSSADLVIAHAGMGTILSALRHEKPLLVMPRLAMLGEQRNEHQLATARRLMAIGKVSVAFDEAELVTHLDRAEALRAREPIGPYAEPRLIAAIREFIHAPSPAAVQHPERTGEPNPVPHL
jgi:UDP-N-acetylglucosamine transferase subunit ALG13